MKILKVLLLAILICVCVVVGMFVFKHFKKNNNEHSLQSKINVEVSYSDYDSGYFDFLVENTSEELSKLQYDGNECVLKITIFDTNNRTINSVSRSIPGRNVGEIGPCPSFKVSNGKTFKVQIVNTKTKECVYESEILPYPNLEEIKGMGISIKDK